MNVYSFNDICKTLTGFDAYGFYVPKSKKDWLCIARQMMSGLAIIWNMPEYVTAPSEGLELFDKSYEDFCKKYDSRYFTLNVLFSYITDMTSDEELLNDREYAGNVPLPVTASLETLMYRIYLRFAKAVAKAYICEYKDKGLINDISMSKWLKENNLATFRQFVDRQNSKTIKGQEKKMKT